MPFFIIPKYCTKASDFLVLLVRHDRSVGIGDAIWMRLIEFSTKFHFADTLELPETFDPLPS